MQMTLKRKRPDGSPMFAPPHRGLAQDRVRYVGDPVAMVIAETRAQAEDAAELVEIDYEPLPSVTSTAEAIGGARGLGRVPATTSPTCSRPATSAATDAALAAAPRIVRRRYVITRVHAQYMEAARRHRRLGPARGALHAATPTCSTRTACATRSPPTSSRCPSTRSAWSRATSAAASAPRAGSTPSTASCCGRPASWGGPVKWTCDRREAIPADEHARDNVTDAELALDADGRFLGLRVRTLANVGAYVSSDRNLLATFSNVVTLVGVYAFPAAHVEVLSVLTNTNSTAPYRGAGRPEATYVIERLIDDAARELGLDRFELRRRNLIPTAAMPYKNPLGVTYDCGNFPKSIEDALALADVAGFPARREASKARGKLRGLGIANAIERAAGAQPEFAEIRFAPERDGHAADGQQEPGPGPRDHLQADPERAARPRSRARSATSTATPTGSPSAWARWARAPRSSAAPRCGWPPTRSSPRARRSPPRCWRRPRRTSSSRMRGSRCSGPTAG